MSVADSIRHIQALFQALAKRSDKSVVQLLKRHTCDGCAMDLQLRASCQSLKALKADLVQRNKIEKTVSMLRLTDALIINDEDNI